MGYVDCNVPHMHDPRAPTGGALAGELGCPPSNYALARGKKAYDERAAIKERDWRREKERLVRTKS
jgi:hypothetical protein